MSIPTGRADASATTHCAIILTSNRSFGEWGDVFGDSVVAAALLERLPHHAIVVQIEASRTACENTLICCRTIRATGRLP